jgi:toxin ParE1/3/4
VREEHRSVRIHYTIKPRADSDLEDYADYLARNASVETAFRFLDAANETFSLLATQPNMGWHARLRHPELTLLRVFRVVGFERILIFYRPLEDGVDILRVVHGSRNLRALFRRRDEIE